MRLRAYNPSDCNEIAELFFNTIHTVNAKDYTKEQLDVWANGNIDLKNWNNSFLEHYTVVAVEEIKSIGKSIGNTNNEIIVGFGDIDKSGYLDRLYIHKDYQHKGIATIICDELEKKFNINKIVTHSSITNKSEKPTPKGVGFSLLFVTVLL